jgi:hypothetical protein
MANFVIAFGSTGGIPTQLNGREAIIVDKAFDLNLTAAYPGIVQADTIDVFNVPADTFVLRAGVHISRAATTGGTGTIALATVAPAVTLVTGVATNATGYTWGTTTATVVAAAGSTIRMSFATALSNAAGRALAHLLDVSAITAKVN